MGQGTVRCSIFCATVLLGCWAIPVLAQQPYHIIDHWKVGGTGGWDYLVADPGANLLYVTHGPRVEVIDTQTGKSVGAITGMKSTHGVALDTEGRFGYISDGAGNSVVIFDRKNFSTVATVPAGTNPDGIVYEPVTKTVWAFNGRSQNVTVIDTGTRSAIATIALPGKPESPQADGKGQIFDNIEDKNSIVELDARSKKLMATWPLKGCDSPSGLALDRGHGRLFAVCDGRAMAVVNAETGQQIATAPIGDGPDATAYDAKDQLAFSSNGGDGTLTVIDAAHGYKPIETLPTKTGGRTMAYDAGSDRVYVMTAEYGPKPQPSPANPRGRPPVLPDTFTVLVIGRR